MIPQVHSALNTIVGSVVTLSNAAGAGRVFELFVLSEIARGLLGRGFVVWLQRSDGTVIVPADPVREFIQRGGAPTGIKAASLGPSNASTIGFRWRNGPEWEIWNGIQFEGRSGAAHEIDVSIVPKGVADALRVSGGLATGRPRVAVECKDVSTSGSLDEMRAFIARLYDMTLLRAHHRHMPRFPVPYAIHPGSPPGSKYRAIITYWQENRRTKNVIARRTGFVAGTAPLAQYHRVEPHQNIAVGSGALSGLVQTIVDWAYRNAR